MKNIISASLKVQRINFKYKKPNNELIEKLIEMKTLYLTFELLSVIFNDLSHIQFIDSRKIHHSDMNYYISSYVYGM